MKTHEDLIVTTHEDAPASAGTVESINGKLFAEIDSEDEKLWLVGGSNTASVRGTWNPVNGPDLEAQWDWNW